VATAALNAVIIHYLVTCLYPGHDFAARVAAGLAIAVGMPHMIARGESE
jgi:hypothetical protein